jgi:hypothetical protein
MRALGTARPADQSPQQGEHRPSSALSGSWWRLGGVLRRREVCFHLLTVGILTVLPRRVFLSWWGKVDGSQRV